MSTGSWTTYVVKQQNANLTVIAYMSTYRSSSPQARPYVVEPPRARDAMTVPLRNAYPRGETVPVEWLECLERIDAKLSGED